jgi:hypothetical protein
MKWLFDQIASEEVCRVLAEKYNEFRRARVRGNSGDLSKYEAKLQEVTTGIDNIIKAVEQGVASQTLMARLTALEADRDMLTDKVKFLQGVDPSEIYITPLTIRKRFEEIPRLLQQAEPFEVNRTLKPLLIGKNGIRLIIRKEGTGEECYWAVGSVDIGKMMRLASNENQTALDGVAMSIPLELKLV